ncbi:MAG: hypothetical protein CMO01_18755 [Thalassobius sp.]|nr:hypothetical protein [Thalassovita sp.]
MRLFLISLSFLFVLETSAQDNFLQNENLTFLKLLHTQVPIIEGELNGKKAYFIVDTGSTLTVLDLHKKKHFGFSIYKNISKKLHGFGGTSMNLWLLFDTYLYIGGKQIATNYTGTPLKKLREDIQKKTGYEISGILGSDVMRDYGMVVDYVNMRCIMGVGQENTTPKEKDTCTEYKIKT